MARLCRAVCAGGRGLVPPLRQHPVLMSFLSHASYSIEVGCHFFIEMIFLDLSDIPYRNTSHSTHLLSSLCPGTYHQSLSARSFSRNNSCVQHSPSLFLLSHRGLSLSPRPHGNMSLLAWLSSKMAGWGIAASTGMSDCPMHCCLQ